MLDLEKIEAQIDKLFEEETPNSLSQWLMEKRAPKINELLGEGVFVSLQVRSDQFRAAASVYISTKVSAVPADTNNHSAVAA